MKTNPIRRNQVELKVFDRLGFLVSERQSDRLDFLSIEETVFVLTVLVSFGHSRLVYPASIRAIRDALASGTVRDLVENLLKHQDRANAL